MAVGRRRTLVLGALVLAVVSAGALAYSRSSGDPLPPISGIRCQEGEQLAYHIHVRLDLFDRGSRVEVPANIGVFPECLYWVHTHDNSGLIHVEAPEGRDVMLRDLMAIWGQTISDEEFLGRPITEDTRWQIRVGIESYRGDPGDIIFEDGDSIVMCYDMIC